MAHWRRKRGGSFSNISFSRRAAKAPRSLAASSADVVLLPQLHVSLYQLKNQCCDVCDSHHRAHNYHRTCAAASVRLSLRTRAHCLFIIRKPPHNLGFHQVHHRIQMPALARAWQNTNTVSLSVTLASPLSTPVAIRTERVVTSPIDCHSDVSILSGEDLLSSTRTSRDRP
jgi:hypothetical protein